MVGGNVLTMKNVGATNPPRSNSKGITATALEATPSNWIVALARFLKEVTCPWYPAQVTWTWWPVMATILGNCCIQMSQLRISSTGTSSRPSPGPLFHEYWLPQWFTTIGDGGPKWFTIFLELLQMVWRSTVTLEIILSIWSPVPFLEWWVRPFVSFP